MFLKVFCLFISLSEYVLGYPTVVTLHAPFGTVSGMDMQNYTTFMGIPYGLVDENNPFGNAKPHPYLEVPRKEVLDLTMCPHYVFEERIVRSQIQCLRLNVYKPNVIEPGHTLPVMVYIHGGEFVEGSGGFSQYFPEFLLEHDVIVVAVNYRLGPYGNLCLPGTEYTNQALKDQTLALRWVKNHIGSFGGDSDNILLFGHSSGSIAVHLHLLFNKDILFNKVILQSGVAQSSIVNRPTDIATFVKDVGLDADNIDVDLFIQTISAIDIHTVINITKFYGFWPNCIDGDFIRKTPNMRNLQNIKLMIGGTTDEMLYFYPSKKWYNNLDFVSELKRSFLVSIIPDSDEAIAAVEYFYLDNTNVNFEDYVSDLVLNYPIDRTVRYFVQSNCTVYRYLFSYDGERNNMKIRQNVSTRGSIHGDELGYLFCLFLIKWDFWNISKEDKVITDRMTRLWTNFAKYGDPTPKTSELLPVKWTPVTAGAKPYLQIDTNLVLHNGRPFEDRMAFWDSYYEKYGMYAKGISLGEGFTDNRSYAVDISKFLLWISVSLFIVWQ